MKTDKEQPTIVQKEMGITHRDFYGEIPNLLSDIPYHHIENTIKFQLNRKNVEIILGPEGFRELSRSIRLPVTSVTLRFFDFSEEEVGGFIKHFNLKFMKGGG
jgi:hypothetical protein